jgi:DNA-binding LacI/PurR family transcriptional regulator
MSPRSVSIHEVARLAGVSKSTVSRVFNQESGTSPEAIEKVMKACEALKYRPNVAARNLRSRNNDRLGVLVPPSLTNEFMYYLNSEKLEGAVSRAAELGLDLLVFVADPDGDQDLRKLAVEKGLSGILLFDYMGAEVLKRLVRYGIPYVQVNWCVKGHPAQCFIKTDLGEAVRQGFNHLYARGHRDIGLIHFEDAWMKDDVVQSSFLACLEAHGLPRDPGHLVELNTADLAPLLNPRHKAYLSFSYGTTQHLYAHCRQQGLRIPEDMALVCYEFFEFFDYLHPKLTGLQQQGRRMGRQAVDMLAARLRGEAVESILIPTELVVRDSS